MADNLNSADLAFEGAQGFGAEADGGRGGEIVKVTTLADSGEGSLRWALEELEGPRIVVFEVSGEINLEDSIKVNGDVTVAGQTSPGGVTVTGAKLRIVESDVIIRGMQFRPGDGDGDTPENRDGISIGHKNHTVENVVIDSNSFSWSVDELITVWYGAQNVTISNNILAEALQDSIHPKGDHSMGVVIGDGASYVTVANNLIANNQFRNIMVEDDAQGIEFVNNLIYNYGNTGFIGHEGTQAHLIGNVYMAGADSTSREPILLKDPMAGTGYYLEDNIGEVTGSATSKITDSYVFDPSNVSVMPSSEVFEYVLNNAGARYPELNSTDARIIQSVRDDTGRIIDSPDDVGGYDFAKNTPAPSDRDGDGVPDSAELLFGTDPDKFDAHEDADGNGISNIEDYINRLVDGYGQVAPDPGGSGGDDGNTGGDDGGSGGDGGGSGELHHIEAEDFSGLDGFTTTANKNASGGEVLQVKGQSSGEASAVFDGESGTYNLVVGYFDESDGVSSLSVLVNGKTVDSWKWDQDLGSNLANADTLTERVIEGVQISAGDTITLSGTRDGKEPLRVDYVDFVPEASGGSGDKETPPEQEVGGELPVDKTEAETLELLDGWKVRDNTHASGGQVIQASKDSEAKAAMVFEGESGIYDIAINYFDEADGESRLDVLVGGQSVDSWIWDDETSQALASPESMRQHVIEDVRLEAGEAIVLQGYADGGEPLRIDSIEFFADMLLA